MDCSEFRASGLFRSHSEEKQPICSMHKMIEEKTMNIKRTIMVGVALVLAVLMAACAVAAKDQPPAPGSALAGTEWALVSLNGNAPFEGKVVTLRFREASIEGAAGCNTYGGSYTASEDGLSFSGVYATEMACVEPEGIMEQERVYFQALNAAVRYLVARSQGSGDRLELYDQAGAQILAFVAPDSAGEVPANTTPDSLLDCTIDMDETYLVGDPVGLVFALHNPTNRPLYVLTWYTPLEGIAGDIFQATRDGAKLPYQGMLAKRGDPTGEEYVVIEPGEVASTQVDLRAGYDLSTPGSYQVQFTAGLQDVTDDGSLVPQKRDDHRPQSLSCNTFDFNIVPAPERPTPTPVLVVTPTPAPPAGFRRYVNGPSGVSLWVPESWTVIEPGPHWPILQSYPQDKYVGGGAREPGDSKCDLTVHPPEVGVADVLERIKSDPHVTIVSEQEIVLHSGRAGIRREVESMGRSLSLYTEVNERVVVLTCFGELAPFDEIAVTVGPSG
jgi:peptidyl-Lys metalloendopeptidase